MHEKVAATFLPQLVALMNERKVTLVGAPNAMALLAGGDNLCRRRARKISTLSGWG